MLVTYLTLVAFGLHESAGLGIIARRTMIRHLSGSWLACMHERVEKKSGHIQKEEYGGL